MHGNPVGRTGFRRQWLAAPPRAACDWLAGEVYFVRMSLSALVIRSRYSCSRWMMITS